MKTHPQVEQVQRLNTVLKVKSSKNYWRLLQVVLQDNKIPERDKICAAIRGRDFPRLVQIADDMSVLNYPDAATHYAAHQFAALVRKYPYPGMDQYFDPEGEAYRKFLQSEHRCSLMNRFFAARLSTNRHVSAGQFESMRQSIRYIIGDEYDFEEIISEIGFGPGASIGVHGDATNVGRKLLAEVWSVTPGAFQLAFAACNSHIQIREILNPDRYGFSSGGSEDIFDSYVARTGVVRYNSITFVPKTVKTYRSIAVEPLLNGLLQKGIDKSLRKRLARCGIDLSRQAPNAEMARQGSLDDSEDGFVTLDLSSASDSISIGLCREVLPPEWFYLLNGVRSKEFEYKGVITTFQKFCSMGNGFCFPLQTLLFVSMCLAVEAGIPGSDFRVYGDDIVVRKRFAEPLIALLKRCGFRLNANKSHISGPFRESCGEDWFGGEAVRPYILDEPLDSLQSLFKFLNSTLAVERWKLFFYAARSLFIEEIPEQFRFWRPFPGNPDTGLDSSGDEHLISPYCRFYRGVWTCVELGVEAFPDKWVLRHERGYVALMYAALSGCSSRHPFTCRRKVTTSVHRKVNTGATSLWVPEPEN